jgi:hypothetical protein
MDSNCIALMREVIRMSLEHGATVPETAEEARRLGRGLAYGEDPAAIATLVEDLLREVEPDGRQARLPL